MILNDPTSRYREGSDQPVLTRWGTWLDAIHYYAEHYGKIMEIRTSEGMKRLPDISDCEDRIDRALERLLAKKKSAKKQMLILIVNAKISELAKLKQQERQYGRNPVYGLRT
ncbi:hypothetical protein ANN_16216 [Periplaneta americana]|uniref:Uncharacterized protein n=1 Tax=Periplaneta americana TaxID=6978 RepID=A0ABQ8SIC2_PERAM|nr:hypothetical protein ANN_16216 [Periplaneta americana]